MDEETEDTPTYVCATFGMTNPEEEPLMQEWLNEHADRGYRLFDRQVSSSGGASKRIHLVMEMQELEEEPVEDEEEGE